MVMNIADKIQEFIKFTLKEKKAIIGVSGGIDSALVLLLLKRSLPKEQIEAYFMPEIAGSARDKEDVVELEKAADIPIKNVYIDNIVRVFDSLLQVNDRKLLGNIKSRIRMTVLYYMANKSNGMVVGTTNKTEFLTGYFTKFGDGACDLEPLISLTKTEVRELSREVGVPTSILKKPPSAGLWAEQYDERELGFSYEEIDRELEQFTHSGKFSDTSVGKRVSELYENSKHKRMMPQGMNLDD